MRYFESTIEKENNYLNVDMVANLIRFEVSGPRNNWQFIKNFHQFLYQRILTYIREGLASGEMRVENSEDAAGGVLDALSRVIEPILLLEDPKDIRAARLERLLRLIRKALV